MKLQFGVYDAARNGSSRREHAERAQAGRKLPHTKHLPEPVFGRAVALDADARRAFDFVLRKKSKAIAKAWAARHLSVEEIRVSVARESETPDAAGFYARCYLVPLLELLRGAAVAENSAWSAVYLDERKRFLVPADIAVAANEGVLNRVVQADIADLVERIAPRHRRAVSAFLVALHASLEPGIQKPVRLLLIGDCVMTELRAFLVGSCRERETELQVRHQYLSFERGADLNMSGVMEHVRSGAADLVAFSFFTFEGLPLYRALLADAARLSAAEKQDRVTALLRMVRRLVVSVREDSDVPILLHNACGLPLNKWRRRLPFVAAIAGAQREVLDALNRGLAELANGTENVVLIDENAALGGASLRKAAENFFPRKMRRRALFHTSAFGPMLAQIYAPIISAFARLRRVKVLLVDFDNTLWAGVMADGEVEHDSRAQRTLRKLREAGILLVALSKNDPKSIRWTEMVLAPEDFVLHKISWNQKVQSVDEAAQQLNLGRDSFAVVDDNPAELALIADRFPEVVLLDSTDQTTWSALELMLLFPNTRQTEESAARTALYREAANRREAMVAELDYPEMMASLGLRASWSLAREKDLSRVYELLQRTNQFNTTTKRRSLAELRALIEDAAYRVFVYSLGDRFGELGIVGVVILQSTDDALVFDAVVMSCRAMGFGLENLLIRAPLEHMLASTGARRDVRGLFYATERNEPAAGLFLKCGFVRQAESEWKLPADSPLPGVPDWLTIAAP